MGAIFTNVHIKKTDTFFPNDRIGLIREEDYDLDQSVE